MPDDDRIGAVSPAERVALFAILVVIVVAGAYLSSVYLWTDWAPTGP